MSDVYDPLRLMAKRLITAKGQAVTLYRLTAGDYDPITPDTFVPSVAEQCPGFAVNLPITILAARAFTQADNGLREALISHAFRYVILAALGLAFTPEPDDVLRLSEGLVRVLGVIPINPNGTGAITFDLACTLDVQLTIAP